MATLVLTTVGGAIGGPVGAALGAVLGQRVDRALLAPRGREGPRLSELKVQTSSYGTQVPKIFGRIRVAGCVIWATDLIEQRGTTSGGKGQGSVMRYSYAASFAVALSARPITGVGRIWADGKLLRGAAGDWKTKTDFRLYLGDEEQLPDPLIASAVGGGVAPAHRGVAYAVFELLQLADFGNRIPSLTFEVIADEGPVRVGDVARAIGEGAVVGDGPDTPIHGFAASGDTIAGAAEVLAQLSGGWFSCREGGVALANRVADPVGVDARVVTRTRAPVERAPARVEVSHYDPARDYQIGVQRAVRGGSGGVEQVPLAAALPADAAKGLALSTLLTRERMRETRQIVSDARAVAVAPGDAVRVGDESAVWRVVRSSVEAMRVTVDLVPLGHAPDERVAEAGVVNASPDVAIGRTVIAAFELYPSGEEAWATPRLAIAAAGDGPGWRQATVEISRDDGATWQMLGATAAPAIMGTVAAPVGRASATMIDRANVIDVDLLHDGMTLSHADDAQRDRGANLALLGDELIQFARAEQVAPARWRLSLLSRGLNGSAVDVHDAGTRFVLLERDSLLVAGEGAVRLGDRIRVSASEIGDDAGHGEAVGAGSETFLDGRSVAPLAPVHLRWNPSADGGARVTWVRRSRLGWRWGETEAPVGEEGERYRVTVSSVLGERVEMLVDPAITITAAEVASGGVRVAVVQVGTVASSRAAVIEQGNQS
ncbi:Putative phage tail protein [Sphingomonas palmae]|uniref:Putative phage tail protein n=1 Tax=Sphingomonas palmae TaxID=1855283 RepID=A0A1H7MPV2_9SPHN|nr:phage tail protein [Sphingomonas palmae]SEL13262.1 Putative phage tail protein [Sphingomonas palmae]